MGVWVCMGALGCIDTKTQANNTKRDIHGLAGHGHVSRTCMDGKYPSKRLYLSADIKGKEGLRRVGMGSDGCRGMY